MNVYLYIVLLEAAQPEEHNPVPQAADDVLGINPETLLKPDGEEGAGSLRCVFVWGGGLRSFLPRAWGPLPVAL